MLDRLSYGLAWAVVVPNISRVDVMQLIALLLVLLLAISLVGCIVFGLVECKELWNNGVNAETGRPWTVVDDYGCLYLDDGSRRVVLHYMVIPSCIVDALKKQSRKKEQGL